MRYVGESGVWIGMIAEDGCELQRIKTGHWGQVIIRALLLVSATLANCDA